MRHRTMVRGGYNKSYLGPDGGQAGGPILLSRDPTVPLEAATKQYVDNTASNIDASAYTTGTLAPERLPAFTGDITKLEGSSIINITPIGVASGNYTKVTVNLKGQVISGTVITENDIPNLPWNKIAFDKPTTLSGYGITDALNRDNPSMSGTLKVNGEFTEDNQLVNKQYVDTLLTPRSLVGDIEFKMTSTTPTDYLRCSGAVVDKALYAELYSVIGDRYTTRTLPGNGRPWHSQFDINLLEQTPLLNSWTPYGIAIPVAAGWNDSILIRNRLYVLGGWNNTTTSNPDQGEVITDIYSANVTAAGNLAPFVQEGGLPFSRFGATYFTTKNRLYAIGGTSDFSTLSNQVWACPIQLDGTLGTWELEDDFPIAVGFSKPFVTKDRVYLIGGHGPSYASQINRVVYSAVYDQNGVIGEWVAETNFPVPIAKPCVFTTKNRVYVIGGVSSVNGESITVANNHVPYVYSATINDDGTINAWVKGVDLPSSVYGASYYITKGRVYIIGGQDHMGIPSKRIVSAPINEDGTIGNWVNQDNVLPVGVSGGSLICTTNWLYLIGGYVEGTREVGKPDAVTSIYRVPVVGGSNDYSEHVANTSLISDPTVFSLPIVNSPYPGAFAYIRTTK